MNRKQSNNLLVKEHDDINQHFAEREKEILNFQKIVLGKENLGKLGKMLFKRVLDSSSTEQNFTQIYSDHEKKIKMFTDTTFPPNDLSLIKGLNTNNMNINNTNNTNNTTNNYTNSKSNNTNPNLLVQLMSSPNTNVNNTNNNSNTVRNSTTKNSKSRILFPNNSSNSYSSLNPNTTQSILAKHWSKICWLRIGEISNNPILFTNLDKDSFLDSNTKLINLNEIKQGALKNSYLLSCITALCEKPDRITKLFVEHSINQYGLYCVKLCKDGEFKEIVLDDNLPCDAKKKTLCFSSLNNTVTINNSNTNNNTNNNINIIKDSNINKNAYSCFWLPLLEKAYAKLYGSYYIIEGIHNTTENCLRDLTGAPVLTLDNSTEDIWAIIKNSYNNDYVMIASSGETNASKELLKEVGLIPFNSYTILEAHEINIEENLTEYLIKIRNPWGVTEWIGDWSQFSNLWRDDIKNMLNFNADKDTCFWMNFKDFKHYFSKIQICKVEKNYNYNSIKLSQEVGKYCLLKLSINNNSVNSGNSGNINNEYNIHVYLSLVQQEIRNFNTTTTNTTNNGYSISRFIVCRLINSSENNSTKDIEYIEGTMGKEKEIFKEYYLQQANISNNTNTTTDYLIYVEVDWLNRDYPFVFSSYSSNKSSITLSQIRNEEYPDILNRIYKSSAIKQDNIHYFTAEGAPNCFKCSKVTPEGYAYIYFQNNEEDATLIEDVKYTKFEGLKLLYPYSGTSYYVNVEPSQSKIVLIKRIDVNIFNLYFSFHSNFLFGSKKLLELAKTKGKKTRRKDPKLNIVSFIRYFIRLYFIIYLGN